METARLILGLTVAVTLPWALGGLWLRLLWRQPFPGRPMLIWGYGYLLGAFAVTLLGRAVNAWHWPLTAPHWTLATVLALAPAVWLGWRRSATATPAGKPRLVGVTAPRPGEDWASGVLLFMVLALLGARTLNLGLEIIWRPLFPWDAAMHWATKARVWTELQQLLPFVPAEQWLKAHGQAVFTDYHPDYPPTIPLLQTWMNVLLGGWHERLMNVPWLQCFIALGLAFYGQTRQAGLSPLAALIFVYLLLSLPLLDTHVALAGYADLWLGAVYLAALMAFYHWLRSRDLRQALLALGCALMAPAIKHEGLLWALTLVPALAFGWLGWRRFWGLAAITALALGLVLWWLPLDTVALGGHRLTDLHWPQLDAVPFVLTSLFVFGSWHLLFWFLAGLMLLSWWWRESWAERALGALGIALACAILGLLMLFLATPYVTSLPGYTSVGRITLHLAPATVFLAALWYRRVTALVENAAP